jgi:hypothetical protein
MMFAECRGSVLEAVLRAGQQPSVAPIGRARSGRWAAALIQLSKILVSQIDDYL